MEIIPEEISITEKGLWYEGEFMSWWPFLLAILILIFLILIIIVVFYKKDKKYKQNIFRELKKREDKMREKIDKIKKSNNQT